MIGTTALNGKNDAPFILNDLWGSTILYDLNSLIPPESGWVLKEASAINDLGQIAGHGLYQGEQRAFLLTPIEGASFPQQPGAKDVVVDEVNATSLALSSEKTGKRNASPATADRMSDFGHAGSGSDEFATRLLSNGDDRAAERFSNLKPISDAPDKLLDTEDDLLEGGLDNVF